MLKKKKTNEIFNGKDLIMCRTYHLRLLELSCDNHERALRHNRHLATKTYVWNDKAEPKSKTKQNKEMKEKKIPKQNHNMKYAADSVFVLFC